MRKNPMSNPLDCHTPAQAAPSLHSNATQASLKDGTTVIPSAKKLLRSKKMEEVQHDLQIFTVFCTNKIDVVNECQWP